MSRPIFTYNPAETVTNIAGTILTALSRNETRTLAYRFSDSFDVALPYLIQHTKGKPIDNAYWEVFFEDLQSMFHYYILREYLYYTYNATDSFNWDFSENAVHISFADRSIVRQFAQGWHTSILNMGDLHNQRSQIEREAIDVLRGKEELGDGSHVQAAFDLAMRESDLRISTKFDILGGPDSAIELDGYTYAEFYAVYRFLLAKFLYHRYYARANNVLPAFQFSKVELPHEIAINVGLGVPLVSRILRDLTYSKESQKLTPMCFEIIDHRYLADFVTIPDHFIDRDGFAQLLRIQATRSPSHFSRHISGALGNGLVTRLSEVFSQAGFMVLKNVSLDEIDKGLPDIDLLVISCEATLGYYVFACEVKAPIPALWAKDQLRVLRSDSLPKAFTQVTRIKEALQTEAGTEFILNKAFSVDPNPIQEGIMVIQGLIVTSQNSGMFFDEPSQDTHVIDWRTLSHIVKASDGDIVYILKFLKELRTRFDVTTHEVSTSVDDTTITYEAVTEGKISPFPKNEWKSTGLDSVVAEEFYASGGSPFDVLPRFDK